ncbi:YfbU family protein [Microbacterium aquilitoris]|uniref:YfbU family protein n=1 Tax=Microbacterium aquilitoris TaxID=3067307 RepID=UPI00288EE197|nr:YfbU family protein [Microbacterium sp. KSW2-22]MDT3343775.1 YfbU family protein [Microbacterium sp. KSW2-22]
MGTLNVRVDDHVHDRLRMLADEEGVTLSDFIRDLLRDAVIPVGDKSEAHGDQEAPESFPLRDRIVLSLLHRILARVLPSDANGEDGDEEYQLKKAEILESGFTGQYWLEVAGFDTELSKRDSRRVIDILEMHRIITFSIERLAKAGTPVADELAKDLEFRGFDHNDPLEGHMARYVRFMMSDGQHWTELIPQIEAHDRGNSHMQMLEVYQRMLSEYRRIMDTRGQRHGIDDYFLSEDELGRISRAQVHPSNRGRI